MLESTTSFDVRATLKQRKSTRLYYCFGSPSRENIPSGLGNNMKIERTTYEILQILSISLTDKTRLRDFFNKTNFNSDKERCGFSEPSLFNF